MIPPTLQHSTRVLRLVRGLMAKDGSIDTLVDAVAMHRGSPIDLTAANMGPRSLRGYRVALRDRDHIVYPSTASATERDLIISHELAHLLLGHVSELSPHPGASAPTRLVTRHTYGATAESDARRLAWAILRLSHAKQRTARRTQGRTATEPAH